MQQMYGAVLIFILYLRSGQGPDISGALNSEIALTST